MHLDEERVERLLDGELSSDEATGARAHIEQCAECRRRVAEAEREKRDVETLLATVDSRAPRIDLVTLARRAGSRAEERADRPAPPAFPRWAAVLAVVLGLAGIAYALPGSPVRGWLEQVATWARGRSDTPPSVREPGGEGEREGSLSGVAVAPGAAFRIEFRSLPEGHPLPEGAMPRRSGRLAIALTDGDDVHVHAPRGAATFTSLDARLIVDDHGIGATFEIDVPRAAPRVEVYVDDRLVFLKEGDRATSPEAEGPPPYVLPMAPAGR